MTIVVYGCGAEDAPIPEQTRSEPAPAAAGAASEQAPPAIPTIAPADLLAVLDGENGPVVLDVRTPEEYAAGHIEGAINIPHDQIASRLASLDSYRDRDIVVYCRTGRRAGIVQQALRDEGFGSVQDLEGHMVYWKAHELPLTVASF